MIKADLHIHSCYSSDGEHTIKNIFERCKENALSVVSVTDHNSTQANAEAIKLSRENAIRFIPGIEIDCNYQGTDLHLLGYHIHWQSTDFASLEKEVYLKNTDSFSEMITKLEQAGISADAKKILQMAGGKQPTGELIAESLLTGNVENELLLPYLPGGERSDMPYINFYLDYFAQGKPAYVKIDYMDYREAIELVKSNRGIPVVAHPGLNFKNHEEVVEELLEKGAEGLEVFNNYHDYNQIDYFAKTVIKRKALMTCGSDFHGKTKPLIYVGSYKMSEEYGPYLQESLRKLTEFRTTGF